MRDERLGTVLWRGRLFIGLAVVSCVTLALIATAFTDPVYEARTLLRVKQPDTGPQGNTFNAQQASQGLANTYATILNSRSFHELVAPRVANGRYPASVLNQQVSAEAVAETSLVSLSVRSESPSTARTVAQDIGRQFITVLEEGAGRASAEQQEAIQARIETLTEQIQEASRNADATEREQVESLRLARAALTQQLASALASNLSPTLDVTVIGPPTASTSPVAPRPLLNLVAGVLVGLLLGSALAWLRMRIDSTVQSTEEAEDLLNARALTSIPLRRRWDWDDRAIINAFDRLHADVVPAARRQGLKILVVTSPSVGDGKTTVARGLAEAAARAGTDVLVVDGDLRQRQLSKEFGCAAVSGLSDAVLEMRDPLVRPASGLLSFRFLPAGLPVENPSGLLQSPDARDVLDRLTGEAALVIIDTPPGTDVPDAAILAELADGVLTVVRIGSTRREYLEDLAGVLEARSLAALGLVVFEPRAVVSVRGTEDGPQHQPSPLTIGSANVAEDHVRR